MVDGRQGRSPADGAGGSDRVEGSDDDTSGINRCHEGAPRPAPTVVGFFPPGVGRTPLRPSLNPLRPFNEIFRPRRTRRRRAPSGALSPILPGIE